MSNELEVISLTLGELQTNCYLAFCGETRECVIIDPADSGETITAAILENNLHPLAIIFTHGHFDHILGTLELKFNFNIPLMMNQNDLFLIESAQKRAQHWLKRTVDPVPLPKIFLEKDSVLPVGKQELLVLETPGHTPGSISLLSLDPTKKHSTNKIILPPDPIIFTGDTLFKQSIGRADRSYSSPQALKKSIRQLLDLPDNTICYPGHGEITFIGTEKQCLLY